MTKKRKPYRFWVAAERPELKEWLDKLTAGNKMSEHIIEILEFVRINGFENLQTLEGLKKQKLIVEIDDIKSRTAARDAKLIIPRKKISSEQTNEPIEEKNLAEYISLNWNRYVETMRLVKDGWSVTCKLCTTGFVSIATQPQAVERFTQHLEESHSEELIKIVNNL